MPGGAEADVYMIGVQELVDLGPRTVVANNSGHEQRQAALETRIEKVLSTAARPFAKVCSFGMVGLSLLLYVREDLAELLSGFDCDRVKTGRPLAGVDGILAGNKGGVCCRFALAGLGICFINVHLPSGQGNAADRDQHMNEILSDAFQGRSCRGKLRHSKLGFQRASSHAVISHDMVVVLGDFNSRLEHQEASNSGPPSGPPDAWLLHDELLLGRMPSLNGYSEGLIGFPPTYKYIQGSDELNPNRCPAWCDRILYKSSSALGLELLEYDSFRELRNTSDHKPVAALFRVVHDATAWKGVATPELPKDVAEPEANEGGAAKDLKSVSGASDVCGSHTPQLMELADSAAPILPPQSTAAAAEQLVDVEGSFQAAAEDSEAAVEPSSTASSPTLDSEMAAQSIGETPADDGSVAFATIATSEEILAHSGSCSERECSNTEAVVELSSIASTPTLDTEMVAQSIGETPADDGSSAFAISAKSEEILAHSGSCSERECSKTEATVELSYHTPFPKLEGDVVPPSSGETLADDSSAALEEIMAHSGGCPKSDCSNAEVPLSAASVETTASSFVADGLQGSAPAHKVDHGFPVA